MPDIEVTYFKECGHRTIWGQISKHATFRNKKGDAIVCGKCGRARTVKKTVRESS